MRFCAVSAVPAGCVICCCPSEVDVSFESFSEFLSMGGHGLYVWLSYALGVVIILSNLVAPLRAGKRLQAQLARRLKRENNRT